MVSQICIYLIPIEVHSRSVCASLLNLEATISFIIFWDFSMFYQIFLSPQVKRWAIITYKHGIYQLLHELPNFTARVTSRVTSRNFHRRGGQGAHTRKKKRQDLRKLGNIKKVSKPQRMIAQRPVSLPRGKLC